MGAGRLGDRISARSLMLLVSTPSEAVGVTISGMMKPGEAAESLADVSVTAPTTWVGSGSGPALTVRATISCWCCLATTASVSTRVMTLLYVGEVL